MRFPLRKVLLSLLAIILLGGMAYLAIHMKGFSWDKLGTSLKQANWLILLLGLVGIHVCLAMRAYRWTRFSRYLSRARYSSIYTATVMGFSAIFLLGRAGEPIRPLLIARKDRVSVSSEFGIYVLERMCDMASTVVLAAVALLAVQHRATTPESKALIAAARTTGVALLVGLAIGVAFLIYLRLHGAAKLERRLEDWRVSSPIGWRKRVAGLLAGFSQGLQAIRSFNDIFLAVVISGAHWTLMGGVYYVIAHSFGGRLAALGFTDAVLVLAFTMAGSTIQLPGVGGGSQVASFLAYSVILGVEQEPAAAAAIVVWLITFAGSTVLGIPLLIREGWSMGELRRMVRAEKDAEAHGRHIAPPAPEKAKSTAGDAKA